MYPGKDGHSITLINDNVDSDLTDFVKMLIDTYVGIPWQDSKCGYGCSDHASWTRNGFSSAFPFEAPMGKHNRKIHTTGDKLDILDTDLGLHFAKLGLAFAVEMSE
jgi:bacterial leucyl aminopeptidase